MATSHQNKFEFLTCKTRQLSVNGTNDRFRLTGPDLECTVIAAQTNYKVSEIAVSLCLMS